MVTSIGRQLCIFPERITGFGRRRRRCGYGRRRHRRGGSIGSVLRTGWQMVRKPVGRFLGHLGHQGVNSLSRWISGEGFRLTGVRRGGRRRLVRRRRYHRRRRVGGYRRRRYGRRRLVRRRRYHRRRIGGMRMVRIPTSLGYGRRRHRRRHHRRHRYLVRRVRYHRHRRY